MLMKQVSARCCRHPAVLINHSSAGFTLWYALTALFLLGSKLVSSLYMVKMISVASLLSEGPISVVYRRKGLKGPSHCKAMSFGRKCFFSTITMDTKGIFGSRPAWPTFCSRAASVRWSAIFYWMLRLTSQTSTPIPAASVHTSMQVFSSLKLSMNNTLVLVLRLDANGWTTMFSDSRIDLVNIERSYMVISMPPLMLLTNIIVLSTSATPPPFGISISNSPNPGLVIS